MSSCKLRLQLDTDDPNRPFECGAPLSGILEIEAPENSHLELSLEWRTHGLGCPDGEVIEQRLLPSKTKQRVPFSFSLPEDGPCTHRGRLFNLDWHVTARALPGDGSEPVVVEEDILVVPSKNSESQPKQVWAPFARGTQAGLGPLFALTCISALGVYHGISTDRFYGVPLFFFSLLLLLPTLVLSLLGLSKLRNRAEEPTRLQLELAVPLQLQPAHSPIVIGVARSSGAPEPLVIPERLTLTLSAKETVCPDPTRSEVLEHILWSSSLEQPWPDSPEESTELSFDLPENAPQAVLCTHSQVTWELSVEVVVNGTLVHKRMYF